MSNMDVVEINRVAVGSDDLEQISTTKLSNNENFTATQGKIADSFVSVLC